MEDKTILTLAKMCLTLWAVTTISMLTYVAVTSGHDGAILASSFAIIGGLVGYEIKNRRS